MLLKRDLINLQRVGAVIHAYVEPTKDNAFFLIIRTNGKTEYLGTSMQQRRKFKTLDTVYKFAKSVSLTSMEIMMELESAMR